MKLYGYLLVSIFIASLAEAAPTVEDTVIFQPEGSERVVYGGEIAPPEKGAWQLAPTVAESNVLRYYLLSPNDRKMFTYVIHRKRSRQSKLTSKGREVLLNLYKPLREYAASHDGIGPESLDDLDREKHAQLLEKTHNIWQSETDRTLQGPYVHLFPAVPFETEAAGGRDLHEKKKILLVELQPYINDGSHWLLYTDGSVAREEINPDFISANNLTISPVSEEIDIQTEKDEGEGKYMVLAVLDQPGGSKVLSPVIENSLTGEITEVSWPLGRALQNDPGMENYLDFARFLEWAPYRAQLPENPLYRVWPEEMDWQAPDNGNRGNRRNRAPRLTSFSVLGGRAAVEETLQIQPLFSDADRSERSIPIDSIEGVAVRSHPFAAMLAGTEGGSLPLADLVPHDRFLVYSPEPEAILPFLGQGAEFIAELGGMINADSIEYDLKNRYLARLGLDSTWLQKFIKSGIVRETALFFPDLFFIEGTDVTVISRLATPGLVAPFLKMAGINGLMGENFSTHTLADGRQVFWALRDDVLIISTARREMETALTLHAEGGQDSLGQSSEFRYMLTQTPVNPGTRLYAYFSDPFIRRLVGPEVKIGQLRRLQARRSLEEITAATLLARFEGQSGPASMEALVKAGYISPSLAGQGFTIDRDGVAHSPVYGTLAQLQSLGSVPLQFASGPEAEAYNQYLENYNRYWRQYFDPIAIRLDEAGDNSLELTTFILPLIDNTMYNGIKEFIAHREDDSSLKVPATSPAPVTMFSIHLRDKGREAFTRSSLGLFDRYTRISPSILQYLGPGLHLAVMDADPVIALGSGDILGAFNGNTIGIARGGSMMFIPMALSVLTRPCTFYIETTDPERTLYYLRKAAAQPVMQVSERDGLDLDFYQIGGRDEWIYTFNLFGMIKLRYGLEVVDNYLVVRNIPWSPKEKIIAVNEAPLNGAMLQAFPAASKSQLPGIFTSAAEANRKEAYKGMAYLYPLVAGGKTDLGKAADEHARLFGFRPVHPDKGAWTWTGHHIVSDRYGTLAQQRQPSYAEDDSFGLLRDIEALSLNLQFEDEGLRTILRWSLR